MTRKEELERENQELMKQRAALKARQREVAAELDGIAAQEEAARVVDRMSDKGKEALKQVLGVTGIQSGEEVGTPRAS